MDYLTQYYKNRSIQLQQELEQLTEAVLAKGDPNYYQDNSTTQMGWPWSIFRGELRAGLRSELRSLIKNLHPDKLRDTEYMKEWLKGLTAEQRSAWKQVFPDAIRVANGTNGVNGRVYWMYMQGKQKVVFWWDEASQTWRTPSKTGTSPWGDYIHDGNIWGGLENATSSISSDIPNDNQMTGGRNEISTTSNKNDRIV